MDDPTNVENIIKYHFTNSELLKEAMLAAGASTADKRIEGDKQGNKRLALIGDALIRLDIVDRWHASGANTGE